MRIKAMASKMSQKMREKINANLYGINRIYHTEIPLGAIFNVLKSNGVTPIQEDGTEWTGFLCGETGRTEISLKHNNCDNEITDSMLIIGWYKLVSGRYEINAYIS
jgi:hypothetical protein